MPIPMRPDLIISGDNLRVIEHTRGRPKKRKYSRSLMAKVVRGAKVFLSSPWRRSPLK